MGTERTVAIPGPEGQLDARVMEIDGARTGLVMCHPHPLFSGTMDNKVVTTAARAVKGLGLNTLRFNFRGVGSSDGEHDHGVGEQQDVASAVRYAKEELGWERIILAGFSFGAGMACLYGCDHAETIDGLVLIAPAVHHFDAPTTLPQGIETWVLMGDADEVVPFDEVEGWVQLVVPQPHWLVFEGAGHFFHGRITDLKSTLTEELSVFVEG